MNRRGRLIEFIGTGADFMLNAFVTSLAFWVMLTRIKDNKHFPVDVAVGAILGFLGGMMVS